MIADPKRGLGSEQIVELLATINDAINELQIQRSRILERLGPTAAEVQDLGSSIERLQKQARILEPLLAPPTPSTEIPAEVVPIESKVEVEEEAQQVIATVEDEWLTSTAPSRRKVEQYFVYYWIGVSKDQLNFWVFYESTRQPSRQEASIIIERAIQQLGGGYWGLVQDFTVPPEKSVLFRDNEELDWGWETGIQELPVELEAGHALVRKLKIEDWLEHPEPQRPKEITVRAERILG
jgi:hypothetical protein